MSTKMNINEYMNNCDISVNRFCSDQRKELEYEKYFDTNQDTIIKDIMKRYQNKITSNKSLFDKTKCSLK